MSSESSSENQSDFRPVSHQINCVYHFEWTLSLPLMMRTVEGISNFTKLHAVLKKDLHVVADKFIYQLEKPEGTDNYHYQGYMHTGSKTRPTTLAQSLRACGSHWAGVHVSCASTAGILALQKYSMKPTTRIGGPWADKALYLGTDLAQIGASRFPWQQTVMDMTTIDPDDRSINWVFNSGGNVGKSKFCKYMSFTHNALALGFADCGDILNLVSKFPGRKLYMFDLTRAKPRIYSTDDLYSTIESIKNGYFINTKYETAQVMMDIPHVWVFSNSLPDFQKLTGDRWCVWTINGAKELKPYSPQSEIDQKQDTFIPHTEIPNAIQSQTHTHTHTHSATTHTHIRTLTQTHTPIQHVSVHTIRKGDLKKKKKKKIYKMNSL